MFKFVLKECSLIIQRNCWLFKLIILLRDLVDLFFRVFDFLSQVIQFLLTIDSTDRWKTLTCFDVSPTPPRVRFFHWFPTTSGLFLYWIADYHPSIARRIPPSATWWFSRGWYSPPSTWLYDYWYESPIPFVGSTSGWYVSSPPPQLWVSLQGTYISFRRNILDTTLFWLWLKFYLFNFHSRYCLL